MNAETTCCFTGHRPEKLPWGYDETDLRCIRLKEWLAIHIEQAYRDGYRWFITGMAMGIDLYCAELVLALKRVYPDVCLLAALPCATQSDRWSKAEQTRYHQILDCCDRQFLVRRAYSPYCMIARNRYMVNQSSRVIAVCDYNLNSGTKFTVNYALSHHLQLELAHPADF